MTSHRGRWIFPKGLVEPGESPRETALKEVREEAGVQGTLLPKSIGEYVDRKWLSECTVRMYLFEYEGECEPWEERNLRERRWCTFDDALQLIKKPDLRRMLKRAEARLAAG